MSTKKVLLVFDLSKTLMLAARPSKYMTFDKNNILQEKPHNDLISNQKIFFRPGRNDLLDYLFQKEANFFDVGIWSSLEKEKTTLFAKSFFERYFRNLLFLIATRREEYEGIKSDYGTDPIPIKRDLEQLFTRFPQYDMNNTMVINNFPNIIEKFKTNDLIVSRYSPVELGDKFEIDFTLFTLVKYLRGLKLFVTKRGYSDIRPILASKSFNQMDERVTNTNLSYTIYN